jgi:cell division septal protein FtsQ
MAGSSVLSRRSLPAPGVALPEDKRFRRPDVRPAGRRQWRGWLWRAAKIAAALAILAGGLYGAASAALAGRWFVVSRVNVEGNTRLSAGDIDALLQGLRGQPIFRLNLDAYRRRLMDSPWVAGATLRRVLPGTIEIRLVERAPIVIARIGGRLYLVDRAGVVIDEFGPQYREFDLPLVDGLAAPTSEGTGVNDSRAALLSRFLDAVSADPALRRAVSQIDVSDEDDVVVLLGGDPAFVRLGDGRFLERLRMYRELAPTLQRRLHEIDYVDMRFDERVYVKSKTPAKRAAKKGP